jgi:exopolysaccharide biosynthesis polyprenyl glycosylphosphotransferase
MDEAATVPPSRSRPAEAHDRGSAANEPRVPSQPRWEARYSRAVILTDLAAVLTVVAVGHVLGLGDFSPMLGGNISPGLGLVITALTVGCLFTTRAWDHQVLGQGSEEFTRLIKGFVTSAVLLGLASLAMQLTALRPWVFGLLPLAGLLSLIGRFTLRKWLHHNRARGRFVHPTLVVGSPESAAELIERTRRDQYNGWEVQGVCTPTGTGVNDAPFILGVPVLGDLDVVGAVAREREFRIVSVCTTPGWAPRRLHQLAWDLEGLNAELVVDPGLMEIAGPRMHVAPVDGFPMLRLTAPSFDGISRVVKSVIDWVGALLLVLLIAPLLLGLAIAVKLDRGPVFFRQERIGKHGRKFRMIKFRSMVVDAEKRKAELLAANEGAGPMFKMRADPRITRVGATLRKYSLDELPQLFNVLAGSMSLVGPRPPLPEEVATYSRDAERKLMVKPGLTGLWQVSGRSDLSWEESVRLDMRYVENWTLAMDALILWKTIGTLARGHGAY